MKFTADTTYGEKYGPAMQLTDQAAADEYFETCIVHTLEFGAPGMTRAEAERIERQNLGYYAGYYDHETRLRVERLFKTKHPMLPAAADKQLRPDEVLRIGYEAGQQVKLLQKLGLPAHVISQVMSGAAVEFERGADGKLRAVTKSGGA